MYIYMYICIYVCLYAALYLYDIALIRRYMLISDVTRNAN